VTHWLHRRGRMACIERAAPCLTTADLPAHGSPPGPRSRGPIRAQRAPGRVQQWSSHGGVGQRTACVHLQIVSCRPGPRGDWGSTLRRPAHLLRDLGHDHDRATWLRPADAAVIKASAHRAVERARSPAQAPCAGQHGDGWNVSWWVLSCRRWLGTLVGARSSRSPGSDPAASWVCPARVGSLAALE
jgi:hypothetical protein